MPTPQPQRQLRGSGRRIGGDVSGMDGESGSLQTVLWCPLPPFCHRDSLGVVLLKWTAPGSHSCGTGASAVGRCCRDSAGWASVARSASRRPPLSPPWVLAARVHPESEPGAQGEGPGLGSGSGAVVRLPGAGLRSLLPPGLCSVAGLLRLPRGCAKLAPPERAAAAAPGASHRAEAPVLAAPRGRALRTPPPGTCSR